MTFWVVFDCSLLAFRRLATDGATASGPPDPGGSAARPAAAAAAPRPAQNRWRDLDDHSGSRVDRSVRITLPVDGKPYNRGSFIARIAATVGVGQLEAIGPSNQGHVWNVTFQTTQAKQSFVDGGDFDVAGRRALVAGVKNARATIRVHWIPYFVPMAAIVDQFRHLAGIKVLSARFETANVGNRESPHEVRTLVRGITVEATTTKWVPHLIQWRHDGASGQGLVTMAGRPGVCLRCLSPSHFRRDCLATFCGNCRKWGQHETKECTVLSTWALTTAPTRSATEMDELNEEDAEPEARREFDERRRAFLDRFSTPPVRDGIVAAKKAAVAAGGSSPSADGAAPDAVRAGDPAAAAPVAAVPSSTVALVVAAEEMAVDVADAELLAAVVAGAVGVPSVGTAVTPTSAAVTPVTGVGAAVPVGAPADRAPPPEPVAGADLMDSALLKTVLPTAAAAAAGGVDAGAAVPMAASPLNVSTVAVVAAGAAPSSGPPLSAVADHPASAECSGGDLFSAVSTAGAAAAAVGEIASIDLVTRDLAMSEDDDVEFVNCRSPPAEDEEDADSFVGAVDVVNDVSFIEDADTEVVGETQPENIIDAIASPVLAASGDVGRPRDGGAPPVGGGRRPPSAAAGAKRRVARSRSPGERSTADSLSSSELPPPSKRGDHPKELSKSQRRRQKKKLELEEADRLARDTF